MIVCPILIFTDKSINRYDFSETAKLRKISQDEIKLFFGVEASFDCNQRAIGISQMQDKWQANIWYGLPKKTVVKEMNFGGIAYIPYYLLESPSASEISILISSLHISKEQKFTCPIGIESSSENELKRHYFYPFNFEANNSCVLSMDDLRKTQKIFLSLTKKSTDPKVSIVVKRLLRCCDSDQSKELIMIDAVSIAESILCKRDEKGIKQNFAFRAEKLLNQFGFTVNVEEIRELYKIRSELVHFGHSKNFTTEKMRKMLFYTKKIIEVYVLDEPSISAFKGMKSEPGN